jgi:phosphosulfolactate phosphohydrolase-like enzyme
MNIKLVNAAAHGKKRRYYVVDNDGSDVAWFDDLETAGSVLRYLKGTAMGRDEAEAARAAMRAFDQRQVKDDDTE